ncbi:zinc ribbon domain-containing protein [Methylobacter tundripaludum]|uniref:Uncharacterized protein n=1 Tax=Methylobacter tundripaludum (strain ATCC BAA-1195 / DSM 17260 / SV96) TaxID=697282 RepID=G3IRC6_METTV|nr:zinc ribbon domain-containing protein [Methylobacter tundripaludum]EGW22137.1 hypothetical protein Mettu_0938 [Methylobacter tundripaludum SV96]
MSSLVECKSCKHQVDRSAKTCPNCGAANPGVKAWTGCLVVFILIAAVGSLVGIIKDNNTVTTDGSPTQPKSETAKPIKKENLGMGFTTTEFISAYKNAAKEMNLTINPNNLTVNDSDNGEEQITNAALSNNLALIITANKISGDVTDIIFIGTGDGTLKSGANVLEGILSAVIATNPKLSKADRGSVINSLGFGSKRGQLGGTAIRNGIKYTLTQTETMGTWLTISSTKDEQIE